MKLFLKIFFISFFLSVLLSILRGGYITVFSVTGFCLSSIVGFVFLEIWSLFCIHRYRMALRPINIIIIIFIGVSIIEVVLRIRNFSATFISFPNLVIWWLGILSGYILSFIPQRIFRISFIIATLTTAYWLSIPGYAMFLHNLNFGTFTGTIYEKVAYPTIFHNSKGDKVDLMSSNHSYLILDFWHSYCGICFQDFPEVQKLYDEIKKYPQLSLYSIHCYMPDKGENCKTGQEILLDKKYTFPTLSLDIKDKILDSLRVKYFPTILILDSCNNIVHRGNIESTKNKIREISYIKNK